MSGDCIITKYQQVTDITKCQQVTNIPKYQQVTYITKCRQVRDILMHILKHMMMNIKNITEHVQ